MQQAEKQMADSSISLYHRLIISVVSRNSGEKLVEAAREAGARGGTIIQCRSVSDNTFLQFLGIDESDKDMVLILTENCKVDVILSALVSAAAEHHSLSGYSLVTDVSSVMKCMANEGLCSVEKIKTGADYMEKKPSHEMITVIVNSGYAEEVMSAARKAGAKGGTILNARGTGREEDVKFFGITIVPEKEILLLVVEQDSKDNIINAIKDLVCFTTPGSGICFTSAVNSFTVLGKRKK